MNHDRRIFFAKLALGLSVSAITKNVFIAGEGQLSGKWQEINRGEIRELFPILLFQ